MGQRRATEAVASLASVLRLTSTSTSTSRRPSPSPFTSTSRSTSTARGLIQTRCRRYSSTLARSDGPNIAVVGGGLTGLTAAYYLARDLPPTSKITLLEAGDRLGGWIRTDRLEVDVAGSRGVVSFERGPRTLSSLSRTTWRFDDLVLYDLAISLGLKLEMPADKPRHIYYPDHLVPLPPATSIANFIREPLFLESIPSGIGFLLRRLRSSSSRAPPTEDLSISEWLRRVCGRDTMANNVVSAVVHGIYGGDVDRLSAQTALDAMYWAYYAPRVGDGRSKAVPVLEEMLLRRLGHDEEIQRLALREKGSLLHFGAAGMESLPLALADALAGQANVDIRLNEPVMDMAYDQEKDELKVTTRKDSEQQTTVFDKVIATVPAQKLSQIASLPALSAIDSVSIMTVNMWYPHPHLNPRGVGYLIPRSVSPAENPAHALGVFFDSDIGLSGPSEPAGTKLFVLMGGHYYNREGVTIPSEEEAVQQAKELLERHLGIPRATPGFAMARLARDCIPQHRPGHNELLEDAEQEILEGFGGKLAVAGGSYSRIGAMGAMRGGFDIAEAVVEDWVRQGGGQSTGLEFAHAVGESVVLPLSEIPVRRFRTR